MSGGSLVVTKIRQGQFQQSDSAPGSTISSRDALKGKQGVGDLAKTEHPQLPSCSIQVAFLQHSAERLTSRLSRGGSCGKANPADMITAVAADFQADFYCSTPSTIQENKAFLSKREVYSC